MSKQVLPVEGGAGAEARSAVRLLQPGGRSGRAGAQREWAAGGDAKRRALGADSDSEHGRGFSQRDFKQWNCYVKCSEHF